MEENKNTDKKSLKFLKGRNTDWDELAKDCVSFANAQGGSVLIGIEDKDSLPRVINKMRLYGKSISLNRFLPPNLMNKNEEAGLGNWLGRLVELELIINSGKGKGTQYAVNPEFIRKINFKGKTNLKNIEDYRLEELIYKDLKAYPDSGFSEIHSRIGLEINMHKVRRVLKKMVDNHTVKSVGINRWARYSIEQIS